MAAVKANARARLGQPPPGQVLPDPKRKHETPRYKQTLAELLRTTADWDDARAKSHAAPHSVQGDSL